MQCEICGCDGRVLHQNVSDYYFGYVGKWDYYKCSNRECSLVWIGNEPTNDELSEAYSQYYTHAKITYLDRFKKHIIELYSLRLICPDKLSFLGRVAISFFILLGLKKREEEVFYSFGGIKPFGSKKLLDVGCGNGNRL